MNVIVAAPHDRRDELERAVAWACDRGALHVEHVAGAGVTVAVAHDGGPAVTLLRSGEGGTVGLGPGRPSADDVVRGRAPGGTVAARVTGDRAVAAAGAGNQRWFVHRGPRGPLVATHVGALVAALDDEVRLDRSYEDFLLGFGFLPDGRTPFAGITALGRPGAIDLRTGEQLVPPATDPVAPHDGPLPDLAELVCEIVDEQAGDATTVGVLLGGFDSALVAAALGRTGRDVHTFTFTFDEPGYDQRNVDAVVRASGAEHHWVSIRPDRLGAALADLPSRINNPSPQPHYQLQTIFATEEARAAGSEVVFTGDGCDALFAAYPTINTRAAAAGNLQRLPAPVRRAALGVLGVDLVEGRLGHVARVGRSALRASLLRGTASRHLPTQYLDDVALARLRGDAPPQAEHVDDVRYRLAEASGLTDPARLAVDGNALTGQSQSKVEGAVARAGTGVVSPFTHPRFRSVIAALPADQQRPEGPLRGAEGKPVLQRAAERAGLLPPEVIYQPKQSPTTGPIDQWYAGPLRATVLDLLEGLPFEPDRAYLDEILRPKRLEDLYRRKVAISRHTYQAIGLLASYAAFTRLAR